MAAAQSSRSGSRVKTRRWSITPDQYQNKGDPRQFIGMDHRGTVHTRFLSHYGPGPYRVLQKKQPSHEVPHQRGHATPRPPIQCCLLNFVFGGLQKKQPFQLMMLGTSDHNIEVGGCGCKQGISVVSCGWLFFLKNPVSFFWGSEFIFIVVNMHVDVDQHTSTHIDATTSASKIYALSKHALL